MKYDLLIPVCPKDFNVLRYCLRSIRFFNPQPEEIFLVSPRPQEAERITKEEGIEARVYGDEQLFDFAGEGPKPGWFQQIIKLCQTVTRDDYLVWDSDMILTRRLGVFNSDDRPFLRYHIREKPHVNQSYLDFMMRCFGQRPVMKTSMVCHHMFFQRPLVREMMSRFWAQHPKPNGSSDAEWFYRWLIGGGSTPKSSISEYEAYAHFVLDKFPDRYEVVQAQMSDITFVQGSRTDAAIKEWLIKLSTPIVALHKRERSLAKVRGSGDWSV